MDCLLGLDIGTSAVKGTVVTSNGNVIAVSSEKFTYGVDGNVRTLDPEHYVQTCFGVIKRLVRSLDTNHKLIAVCPCCASGNLILLDADNETLTDIIGWQTLVPEDEVREFFSDEEKAHLYKTVGWPVSGHFPAVYIAWIKKHKNFILQKTRTVAMSAEYLNYILTDKWGISQSMGTPFFLMNQEKGCYNQPLLVKLGISNKQLPPIYDKGTVLGTVKEDVAKELDISPDVKIVLGSFDHPSGATGAGVFESGEMLLSCGTSWVEFFPVKSREFAIATGALVDRFMLDGSPYCVMKSLTSVSEKIMSLKKHYFGDISYKDFDALAEKSQLGCGGLSFDYTENDYSIGADIGKHHIARAIIETAAIRLKNNLTESEKGGLKADKITMIGGITNSDVCVRIIAQALERDISVVNGESAGAVGAAMLAGIGAGIFKNEKDAFSRMNLHTKVYRHSEML